MSEGPAKVPTAALVVIGNEILSGKVTDLNSGFMARRLYELGVEVRCIETIPDEVEEIVRVIRSALERFDLVLTSGGVGPTHDDVTIEAVAKALDRQVVRSPILEKLLRQYYKVEMLSPAQARMADIPEGSQLIYPEGNPYPQLVVDRVFVFPGVPEHLQARFELVSYLFEGQPMLCESLEVERDETEIAHILSAVAEEFASVKIGSYPRRVDQGWIVRLVLESRDREQLGRAVQVLRAGLGLPQPPSYVGGL